MLGAHVRGPLLRNSRYNPPPPNPIACSPEVAVGNFAHTRCDPAKHGVWKTAQGMQKGGQLCNKGMINGAS